LNSSTHAPTPYRQPSPVSDLIRTGLAGGDNRAMADRLMRIERRLVALEQQGEETNARVESIDKAARDLLAMFEALLKALSGESSGRAA
jgi:hypothetical protein